MLIVSGEPPTAGSGLMDIRLFLTPRDQTIRNVFKVGNEATEYDGLNSFECHLICFWKPATYDSITIYVK